MMQLAEETIERRKTESILAIKKQEEDFEK